MHRKSSGIMIRMTINLLRPRVQPRQVNFTLVLPLHVLKAHQHKINEPRTLHECRKSLKLSNKLMNQTHVHGFARENIANENVRYYLTLKTSHIIQLRPWVLIARARVKVASRGSCLMRSALVHWIVTSVITSVNPNLRLLIYCL